MMETIFGVYCKEYPNKAYLYEEDINTLEKLTAWMEKLDTIYLTDSGYEYIQSHFSKDELFEIAIKLGCSDEEAFLNYLEYYARADIDQVIIWNDKDVLKNLSGIPDKKFPENFRVIFVGPKLPFHMNDFKYYLTLIKENYEKNKDKFDADLFCFIWDDEEGVENFFDIDLYNRDRTDYDHVDIYYNLLDYDEDMDTRIRTTEKELDTCIKEQGLPLYEKTMPPYMMKNIIRSLNRYPKSGEEYKKAYAVFLDKLSSLHDKEGLEMKAYSYYGGNEYVKEDYKVSEQCLLELLSYGFHDDYADTLGYIYYYGRVNDGIPQYDKAFQYFMMASIVGNVEATYKLADMYKNGYGVIKNEEVSKQCNTFLYPRVMKEFEDYPAQASLADVALRLGSFYTDQESAHIGARLFLEALLAIQIRDGRFDSSVKRSILHCLFDVYKEHKDKILSHNNIIYSLMHFDEYTLTRRGNDLLIKSKKRRLLFDLEKQNAALVSSFHVLFQGEILKDIPPEDNRCDNVYLDDKGNIHFEFRNDDIFVLEKGETDIQFEKPLIASQGDENVYHVALCQYTKGQGRKYTFLIDEDGSVDDEWIIKENGKDIYPIEFTYQKGYELPCDASVMKHIARKKQKKTSFHPI